MKEIWEYGFYDDDPEGEHTHESNWKPEPQPNPIIWWYTFGGLVNFPTAGAAKHTASKSVWGQAVIVRRLKGDTKFELVSE